jgi:hypothetical protein
VYGSARSRPQDAPSYCQRLLTGLLLTCLLPAACSLYCVVLQEAFTESTLEMLVDDAESMLAESLAAAATVRAQEAQQALQQQQGGGGSGSSTRTSAGPASGTTAAPTGHLPPLKLPGSHQGPAGNSSSGSSGGGPVTAMQFADEAAVLARKAAARAACTALAPFEQDLCLLLAAVLRHARHASLDDPRLQVSLSAECKDASG